MQNSNIKVTVLIPIHNTDYLSETLASIGEQTLPYNKFKVLMILDRVQLPDVETIAQQFAFNYEILESPRPGIVSALNYGVKHTETEFIARMDSDDLMLPKRLELQLKAIEKRKTTVAIGGSMLIFRDGISESTLVRYPKTSLAIKKLLPYRNVFSHPAMIIRTMALREVGLYREVKSEDWDLWNRLIEVGKMTNLKVPLIKYRIHQNQISATQPSSEPAISGFIQLSKFMRSKGLPDFPLPGEELQEWKKRIMKHSEISKKIDLLANQEQNRILAQRIMHESKLTLKGHRVQKYISIWKISRVEATLILISRAFRIC